MRSTGTSAAARSTTARTGVYLVPMIDGLVMSAPSQWNMSMISCPPIPGNRYLLPPEKPTTSCGKVGPTISRRSYSSASLLMVTSTRSRMRPPEISATSSSLIVPIEASAFGSFQAWLKILVPAYLPARSAGVRPRRWLIASSLIGGCVPSAIKTSNAVAPASVVSSCSTRNIRSIGALRVWSGTMASTRLPPRPHPAISSPQRARTAASSSLVPFAPLPVIFRPFVKPRSRR